MANDEHLHKAFSYFDKDGNGYILPQELQDALMEDGDMDSANVANDIFQEVDTDKVNINFMSFFPAKGRWTGWLTCHNGSSLVCVQIIHVNLTYTFSFVFQNLNKLFMH